MSLESRVRKLEKEKLDSRCASIDCICFPPDEPPYFPAAAERAIAQSVMCPLHGQRFPTRPEIYSAFQRPIHLDPKHWEHRSALYRRAMEASFPPDRFPAKEVLEKSDGHYWVVYVLKGGTELSRELLSPCWDDPSNQPIKREGKTLYLGGWKKEYWIDEAAFPEQQAQINVSGCP